MANTKIFDDWMEWFQDISQPALLLQIGAVIGCGVAAYVLAAVLRRMFVHDEDELPIPTRNSVLFGQRAFDGVLFPAFWLLLSYVAMAAMRVPARQSIFGIAVPVLVALLVIRTVVKLLRAAFEQARWVRMLEHTLSWAVWIGLVLWISGILDVVVEQLQDLKFRLGGSTLSVYTLLQGFAIVGLAVLVSLWLSNLLERSLLRKASGSALSLRKIISNLSRAVMLFVAVMVALSATGIDLTALSVFGGALGVGIGLGLQKLAANYVSGFVILAERSIRIGDTVKVDGFEGRITDITGRYTVIRSLTGVEAIFPNETLVTQKVENNSLADRKVWMSTAISVGYDSDVELVQQVLVEAALSQPRVLRDPPPGANLENFGADGLDFRLGFWIADPENGTGLLRSEINKHILAALRARQIDIPYPQRVLHHIHQPAVPDADHASSGPLRFSDAAPVRAGRVVQSPSKPGREAPAGDTSEASGSEAQD